MLVRYAGYDGDEALASMREARLRGNFPLTPSAEVMLSYFTGLAPAGETFETALGQVYADVPSCPTRARFCQIVSELIAAGCVRKYSCGYNSTGVLAVLRRLEAMPHRQPAEPLQAAA
jgi:hypothetical protein